MMIERVSWGLRNSTSTSRMHSLLYRSVAYGHGVQMEVHTPIEASGEPGKPRRHWFIDGDSREFQSEEAMLEALRGLGE